MLKFATSLFLVFSILTVATPAPVLAQGPANAEPVRSAESKSQRDLKSVFSAETARFRAESAAFDPVKMDREKAKQQAQKKGWSKTKKTLVITAIAVGFAALIFVAIKYGKKCLRYSDDCTYDPQTGLENCPCEEYEKKNP